MSSSETNWGPWKVRQQRGARLSVPRRHPGAMPVWLASRALAHWCRPDRWYVRRFIECLQNERGRTKKFKSEAAGTEARDKANNQAAA